jgi:uncharacterized membrane protein YbhN (UPF0104 family)
MKEHFRRNRKRIMQIAGTPLAIGLLVLLLHRQGWEEIAKGLRQISLWELAASVALMLLSRLFTVGRWYILLRSAGINIRPFRAISLTFASLFASNFLPTTIGGDVLRLAGILRLGFDRSVCLASIAADRLIGMAGMAMALPFGLPPLWRLVNSPALPASTAVGAVHFPALWKRTWNFLERTFQVLLFWLNRPIVLLGALALSWMHMLVMFFSALVLVRALGEHTSFWLVAGIWSISYFITLVPISIAGYGLQEISLSFLFSNMGGITMVNSLLLAILVRLVLLLASLPGAAFLPAALADVDEKAGGDAR